MRMQPDWKKVEEVMAYREKDLSFRQIARVMKKDVRTVYRWYTAGRSQAVHNVGVGR